MVDCGYFIDQAVRDACFKRPLPSLYERRKNMIAEELDFQNLAGTFTVGGAITPNHHESTTTVTHTPPADVNVDIDPRFEQVMNDYWSQHHSSQQAMPSLMLLI